jgi:hypothetical protein
MPRQTVRDRLLAQFQMTDADVRAIQQAANAVWSECAYDVLSAVAEESNGKKTTVSRAVVIEIVLDADRLAERLRPRFTGASALTPGIERFILNQYTDDGRRLADILMKETFTYAHWGM